MLSLIIFTMQNLYGQCILTNNFVGIANGQCIINNIIGGQSFIACDSGELEEIKLQFNQGGGDRKFVLRFYEGIGFNNLIWTSQEFTILSSNPTTYDISIGSGTNNVIASETYSFSIESTGTDLAFHNYDFFNDSYPDGSLLNCTGTPFDESDINFSLAINDATLPIKLIVFRANANAKNNELYWSTSSEINNSGFELQKSENALDWQAIEFIDGKGTTSEFQEYYYQDFNPLEGTNYYRLKQVDHNGAFEYSKLVSVESNSYKDIIKVYPNPSNGLIKFHIQNPENLNIKVRISDKLGRTVWKSQSDNVESDWQRQVNIDKVGHYFISIQIGKEITFKKVIITR